MSRIQIAKLPDMDVEQWHLAVDGRILGLTLTRPGMSAQLQVIGVNQHVASDENAQLRGILLSTLAHTKEDMLGKGGPFVCLGDFNAAPEGGRWGYSGPHSTPSERCGVNRCKQRRKPAP